MTTILFDKETIEKYNQKYKGRCYLTSFCGRILKRELFLEIVSKPLSIQTTIPLYSDFMSVYNLDTNKKFDYQFYGAEEFYDRLLRAGFYHEYQYSYEFI